MDTKLKEFRLEDSPVDFDAIKGAVRTILEAVGEDPDRPGLVETPRRVAHMYAEMFSGLHLEPERHLKVVFPEEYDLSLIHISEPTRPY